MKRAGAMMNVSERNVSVTFSPANMFAKRRTVKESGRDKMADQFDGDHQRRQRDHGAGEMKQIAAHTLLAQAHPVVVKKNRDRQAQRH